MPYHVIRVGQLVEHESFDKAIQEAIRLTDQTNGKFYVVKQEAVTNRIMTAETVVDIIRDKPISTPSNTQQTPPNAGARWSREADVKMMEMWMKGEHVDAIARKLGRSRVSIQCRLSKYGYDAYDRLVYKG